MNITFKLRELRQAFAATAIFALVLLSGQGIFSPSIAYAASGDIDQAENGSAASPISPVNWINGNVNHTKGHYVEGESVPYRITATGLTVGVPSTLVIGFDVKEGNKFAIDYLTSNDRIGEVVNPCAGVAPCSGPNTFSLPAPAYTGVSAGGKTPADVSNSFNDVDSVTDQVMKIWNGTISSVTYTKQANISLSSDDVEVTIVFTPTNSTAVLSWGGHIASSLDYPGESAVNLNGSPYHMRLVDLDGSGGNQDKSLSASAVPPSGFVTVIKNVVGGTSVASDFTIEANASTTATPSSFSGDAGGTVVAVQSTPSGNNYVATPYSIVEPNSGIYTATYSPDCTGSVEPGESKTCTVTNTYIPPSATLTLVKEVVNQFGTAAAASAWTLHANSAGDDVDGTSGVSATVAPGAYDLSETGGPVIDSDVGEYVLTGVNCTDGVLQNNVLTLANGDSATCTFTNTFVPADSATLIVKKVLTQDNGGTEEHSDFSFTVNAGTATSWADSLTDESTETIIIPKSQLGQTFSIAEVIDATVTGRYNVSYTNTKNANLDCNNLTLAKDETVTCTITNNDIGAQLTVIKQVVDSALPGDKNPADFTMTVTGTDVSQTSFAGSETGVTVSLDAGAYSVSEQDTFGYSKNDTDVDCSGTIDLGASKTCTIINTEPDPTVMTVTFEKVVSSGDALPSAWSFNVVGGNIDTTVDHGDSLDLPVGTYTVTENGPDGYRQVSTSGLCADDGEIVVGTGDLGTSGTCTFTNEFIPLSSITIDKVVTGYKANNDLAFSFDTVGSGVTSFLLSGTGTPEVFGKLVAGTYTFTETDGGARWELTDITCTGIPEGRSLENLGNGSVSLELLEGENVTCTFTNEYTDDFTTDDEIITVRKEVTEGSDTEVVFDFVLTNLDTNATTSFELSDGLEFDSGDQRSGDRFSVVESMPDRYWSQENVVCTDENQRELKSEDFTLEDGNNVNCIFTNDQQLFKVEGYVWEDLDEDGIFDEGEAPLADWDVDATNGSKNHSTSSDETGYYYFWVAAGTWTISENLQSGWDQTFPTVEDGGVHVVVVPEDVYNEEFTQAPSENLFAAIVDFLIPTANAQALPVGPFFNFGNIQQTGGGGGGGSRAPICQDFTISSDTFRSGDELTLEWDTAYGSSLTITANGDEIYSTSDNTDVAGGTLKVKPTEDTDYELTVTRSSRKDTCRVDVNEGPTPQVLGEQVSAVPLGAANTGAGGAAPIKLPNVSFATVAAVAVRRKNG